MKLKNKKTLKNIILLFFEALKLYNKDPSKLISNTSKAKLCIRENKKKNQTNKV
jgi:hypothetical protein